MGLVDPEFVALLISDREREREIGRRECVEVWEFGVVVTWGSVHGRDELRVALQLWKWV